MGMNDRRRFLRGVGASVASLAAPLSGCNSATVVGSGAGGGATTSGTTITTTGAGGAGTTNAGGAGPGGHGMGGAAGAPSTGGAGQGGKGPNGCVQSPAGVAVGAAATFAGHGLYRADAASAFVGRDANGLYAMSSLCTHQGCDMAGQAGGFTAGNTEIVCYCHGSQFDANGQVIQGPAWSPLQHVAIALGCDGQIYVDSSTSVADSFRLTV
jgi:Rieske Fe-S protein